MVSAPSPGPRLFITGGSGFIGRHFLRRLAAGPQRDVTVLSRSPDGLDPTPFPDGWKTVTGHLGDPASYRAALGHAGTIVHLAALTGKARLGEFAAVNVEGTRRLLQAATEAGAARFVFVSSIAAKFADTRHYAYAHSKVEAENVVRAGALPWVILRPTLVLGQESPVLKGLITLVKGPVGICFGKGDTTVQPVAVENIAELLERIADEPKWDGTVIEAGGPDIVSFETLLRQIRLRLKGRPGPLLRLPLTPIRTALAALEPLFFPWLPLTAGQLAAFANDSIAEPHPATVAPGQWKTLPAMVDAFVAARN